MRCQHTKSQKGKVSSGFGGGFQLCIELKTASQSCTHDTNCSALVNPPFCSPTSKKCTIRACSGNFTIADVTSSSVKFLLPSSSSAKPTVYYTTEPVRVELNFSAAGLAGVSEKQRSALIDSVDPVIPYARMYAVGSSFMSAQCRNVPNNGSLRLAPKECTANFKPKSPWKYFWKFKSLSSPSMWSPEVVSPAFEIRDTKANGTNCTEARECTSANCVGPVDGKRFCCQDASCGAHATCSSGSCACHAGYAKPPLCASCAPGYFATRGLCARQVSNGTKCGANTDCRSGNCVAVPGSDFSV